MHLYGLIIGLAIAIGINYFSKHQNTLTPKQSSIFTYGAIIFAIIGARAYHVFDYRDYYSRHLSQIPQTWNGGLGIFGGILGALIFILAFILITRKPLLPLLDSITPILPLCQAIGRLGNFVNREIPTWWLEASLNLLLFFLIRKFPNQPTAKYLIGYGTIRFITEFFRPDTWVFSGIKTAQIISVLFILTGSLLLSKKNL